MPFPPPLAQTVPSASVAKDLGPADAVSPHVAVAHGRVALGVGHAAPSVGVAESRPEEVLASRLG